MNRDNEDSILLKYSRIRNYVGLPIWIFSTLFIINVILEEPSFFGFVISFFGGYFIYKIFSKIMFRLAVRKIDGL